MKNQGKKGGEMPIFIRTHNGKMPAEGGKRILPYFAISEEALKVQRKAAEKARLIASGILIYNDLPTCNGDGDCSACYYNHNPAKIFKTDQGEKRLAVCQKCGQKMRFSL